MENSDNCRISRWTLIKGQLNNLDPVQFNEKRTSEDVILLDVRRPEEFSQGHFANAQNLNYLSPDLADKLEALPSDQTYVVYCRSGRRSLRVCALLQNSGFSKVYNLDGGIKAYEEHFSEVTF